jgi:Tol biopolymer transport system component
MARPHMVLSSQTDDARFHVAPALSPDGQSIVFISERDRLSLDLFLADAATGRVTRKLLSTAADPHFESLQYIHSAGAWDREGRRFALTALSGGDPVLILMDVRGEGEPVEVPLDGIGEAYNPSWSPDGTRIVFSALKGGLSDLFIYSLETGKVERLTADAFADLHPAWSPDGRTIALATDRSTSSVEELRFGALRIGLLDLATGIIRPAAPDTSPAKQVSPQWAPDGRSIYFVSDRSGISNVLRLDFDRGEAAQVTAVAGGITGITPSSPALAVSADAGTLAFSVYQDGRYEIQTLSAERAAAGTPVDLAAPALMPADEPVEGTIAALLDDPAFGRPIRQSFDTEPYDDRLRLEYLSQPYIGASTGTAFGGAVRANFGAVFGDMLRDRQLQVMARVGTSVDDFAAQLGYVNRKGQWNWGVMAGFAPSRFAGARRSIAVGESTITRETTSLRYANQWASVAARFNVDRGDQP